MSFLEKSLEKFWTDQDRAERRATIIKYVGLNTTRYEPPYTHANTTGIRTAVSGSTQHPSRANQPINKAFIGHMSTGRNSGLM